MTTWLQRFWVIAAAGLLSTSFTEPPLKQNHPLLEKSFKTAAGNVAEITRRTDDVVGFRIKIKNHSGKTISTAQTTCPGIPFTLNGVNGFDGVDGEIVQTIKVAEAACDELLTKRNDRQDLALGPQ